MPVLNFNQIAVVAYDAGFRGNALVTAVAVAYAESSGRTDVVNSIGCVGLWQIYQKVHPWAGTVEQLKNPATNARAAYTISKGGATWKPWEAYTNNAYKRYLAQATTAVSSLDGTGTIPNMEATVVSDTGGAPAGPWETLADKETWINVALVVGGLLLIMVALVRISASSGTVSAIAGAAMNVVPGGGMIKKAAKVIK